MERKPLEEMTTEEKINEILSTMRSLESALDSFSSSPMAKMFPGMKKLASK